MSVPETTATDTSVQKPAETTVAVEKPAPTVAAPSVTEAPLMTSAQLSERLERERRTLLKELGSENVDDVKAALAAFKAKQDADKTEAQRNGEKLAELERVKIELADVRATNKARAEREMALLDADQRAAVIGIAGDDTNTQLKIIDKLAPTWAKATTTTQATPVAATAATTAPPRSAPSDTTTAVLSPKEEYARLKATNPILAGHYLTQHAKEIYPSA